LTDRACGTQQSWNFFKPTYHEGSANTSSFSMWNWRRRALHELNGLSASMESIVSPGSFIKGLPQLGSSGERAHPGYLPTQVWRGYLSLSTIEAWRNGSKLIVPLASLVYAQTAKISGKPEAVNNKGTKGHPI
jgi:hypothetical protein